MSLHAQQCRVTSDTDLKAEQGEHRESKDDENDDVTSLHAQQCRDTTCTDLKAEQGEQNQSKDDENDDVTRISTRTYATLHLILT